MSYIIEEVDGSDPAVAAELRRFNSLAPEIFPALTDAHLEDGYWFLAYNTEDEAVAFAGMVPFFPAVPSFPTIGYCKRAYVLPDHRGRGGGLQLRMLHLREWKAREVGWGMLVSECSESNVHSARNLRAARFEQFEPDQKWGAENSIYFRMVLSA